MQTTSRHDLASVRDGLVDLSELVVVAIRDATAAFNTADAALAEKAMASAARTAALSDELDELAMNVPGRQALSPRDVQVLLAYTRASVRLARMGDFARHIAEIARRDFAGGVAPEQLRASFVQMAAQTVEAAELVVRLLRGEGLEIANALVEDDQWTDVLQRAAFAAIEAPGWNGGAERAVYMILVARYLERFGDQAVFIARRVSALGVSAQADGDNSTRAQAGLA